jgi:hypothetical protein
MKVFTPHTEATYFAKTLSGTDGLDGRNLQIFLTFGHHKED